MILGLNAVGFLILAFRFGFHDIFPGEHFNETFSFVPAALAEGFAADGAICFEGMRLKATRTDDVVIRTNFKVLFLPIT